MRTQSPDTRPEAEQVLIGLIRKAPITKRFGFLRSWSYTTLSMKKQSIREMYPDISEEEAAILFVTHHYGQGLAKGLRRQLQKKTSKIFDTYDLLAAMTPVIETFEQLSINYHLEGAVATAIYGMQQATLDIDLVANLDMTHVRPLLKRLEQEYHSEEEAVQDAIARHAAFNSIHLPSMVRINISLPKPRLFDLEVQRRVQSHILVENTFPFYVASAEDIILTQLESYKGGGEVADDQWNSILGILKVQATALDFIYLEQWAKALGVAELLERSITEAKLNR